jgi:hypothetical protein
MKSTIIKILVLVAALTALLPTTAVAARSPKSHNNVRALRPPVMPNPSQARRTVLAVRANAVIAAREARGLTTNPGAAGNDYAPHVQPGR